MNNNIQNDFFVNQHLHLLQHQNNNQLVQQQNNNLGQPIQPAMAILLQAINNLPFPQQQDAGTRAPKTK